MDKDAVSAIKAAVLRQRTYKQEIEGRGFTLVLPTPHERHVAYLKAGGVPDIAVWTVFARETLEGALQGWVNVTIDDITKDGDKTVIEFDPELVPLLLDANLEWTAQLTVEMRARIAVHNDSISNAKKKSETISTGSNPKKTRTTSKP